MSAEAPASGGYRHPSPSTSIVAAAVAELGADAGEVDLATSYEVCRRLHAAHGRTYYYATRFLPAERQRHVHALYGFARYADDLVDHLSLEWTPEQRRAALERWTSAVLADLAAGRSADPVCRALVATVLELGIDHEDLRSFLTSMAMDLTVTRYATYADLAVYVHGSAAVIGSMMLPVLGAPPAARGPAMDLGVAFQLTNFLRDVAEDWRRGRIYLPQEDLARFSVTEWDLRGGRTTDRLRRLLAFEAARTRRLYRRAEAGWALLPPASAACIRIAHHLYGGVLDDLERHDFEVFTRRARVGRPRRAWVTVRELAHPTRPGTSRVGRPAELVVPPEPVAGSGKTTRAGRPPA